MRCTCVCVCEGVRLYCVCPLSYIIYYSQTSLVDCLTKAFDKVDILITSGGVSMGEKVCVARVDMITLMYYTESPLGSTETSARKSFQCYHTFWKSANEARVHLCAHTCTHTHTHYSLACRKPTTFATVDWNGRPKLVFALPGQLHTHIRYNSTRAIAFILAVYRCQY